MLVPGVLFLAVSHRLIEPRFYYVTGEYDTSSRRMRETAFSLRQLQGVSQSQSPGNRERDQGVVVEFVRRCDWQRKGREDC